LTMTAATPVLAACLIVFVGGAPVPIAAPDVATAAPTAPAAAPHNAIDGVLGAFAEYDVVALGEGPHGNESGHRFRVSLIRDPRFTARVNDVVVEFGNAQGPQGAHHLRRRPPSGPRLRAGFLDERARTAS
jgi:hypothetical protein